MTKGQKIFLLVLAACLTTGITIWKTIPITYEMVSIDGYYAWSKGDGDLTSPIYQGFLRDRKLRLSLRGESMKWVYDHFPHASDGANYSPDSYRGIVTKKSRCEVHWLNGEIQNNNGHQFPEEEKWGYYVLHENGKIIRFGMAKG